MSGKNSDAQPRTEALLDQLFVTGLSDDDCRELWDAASKDAQALRRYVEIVHLREGLRTLLAHAEPIGGSELDGLHVDDPLGDLVDDNHVHNSGYLAESDSTRLQRKSFLFKSAWWATAVALSCVLGAIVSSLATTRSAWNAQMAERDAFWQSRSVGHSLSHSNGLELKLGSITGLSPEASASDMMSTMQVGQPLRFGEVVQLSKGFVRVQLKSGAEVIAEGPAEFSLVGDKKIFVRVGRISVTSGDSLTLRSELVTASCLDAEIAFVAEEDSKTSIYVHSGLANLFATPQEGLVGKKLRVLHAQQGMVAHATGDGGVSVLAGFSSDKLVSSWAEVESQLTGYQQLVLSDEPMAYWPLGSVRRNRRVLDLSQNGYDGMAIGNWPVELSDEEAQQPWTHFNGESYIEPDRKPPINLLTGFAVEAWARVKGPSQFRSLFTSRWVLESNTPEQQCFGFTLYAGDDDCWQFWSGNGRKGELWNMLHTDEQVDQKNWSHVVATFVPNGITHPGVVEGTASIYVDGHLVGEQLQPVSLTDMEWPARIGAAEFVPQSLTSWLYNGDMSNVALYDYPLDSSRIAAHYEQGADRTEFALSRLPSGSMMLVALRRD